MTYSGIIEKIKAASGITMASVLTLGLTAGMGGRAAAAACTAPTTDYGSATTTITVPSTATYRIWSRIMAPDATNNTYLLEVDGATCYNVGGGLVPASAWTWVAYQGGSATSYVQQSLAAGSHTLKLIGNAPGVKVDRIVALSDTACVPTAYGDNCNVPDDTTLPSVTLTAPTDGATVSGSTTLSATASDNVGVAKVEFYDNSTLLATDTTSPYSTTWNSSTVTNGSHLITARAYDAAGNVSSDANTITVKNGDMQAPTVPAGLKATAPSYNTVKLTWTASTDDVGVTGYTVMRGGVPIANVNGTTLSYTDTPVSANTTYSYSVKAFDAAQNTSAESAHASVTTPAVPDTQPPTAASGLTATAISQSQINLSWVAASDNIGVVSYDIYRSTDTSAAQKIGSSATTTFGDSSLNASTKYTYYIIAKDAAGNASIPSSAASATTQAPPTTGTGGSGTGTGGTGTGTGTGSGSGGTTTPPTVGGTVTGHDHKPVRHGWVVVIVDHHRYTFQLDQHGRYAIFNFGSGRYTLTYQAKGYGSRTISGSLGKKSLIKNITLDKR